MGKLGEAESLDVKFMHTLAYRHTVAMNYLLEYLGHTVRLTLIDARVIQGQFVGYDCDGNILLRYAESIECIILFDQLI